MNKIHEFKTSQLNKSILNNYFQSLFPIKKEIVEKITAEHFNFALTRNNILINKGIVSTKTYFLEKGYVRSYILNEDNEEVTTNIYSAPCFINDFLSFFNKQFTKETYQTLTDCTLWETNLENVEKKLHSIPEFMEFSRYLFFINFDKQHQRLIEMASKKAETRYLTFLQQQPHVFKHVPLKIIASYLGVTDSTLSRIRKEISRV